MFVTDASATIQSIHTVAAGCTVGRSDSGITIFNNLNCLFASIQIYTSRFCHNSKWLRPQMEKRWHGDRGEIIRPVGADTTVVRVVRPGYRYTVYDDVIEITASNI